MNVTETTLRIEKRFEEDRVEHCPVPSLTLVSNMLRTTRSAPISSIPRESCLARSSTSLLTSKIDQGLMDIWVDDGTSGNIDDTVRLLRFSTAASKIDGLFHSPTNSKGSNMFKAEKPISATRIITNKTLLSSQMSCNEDASLNAKDPILEQPITTNGNSRGLQKANQASKDAHITRKDAANTIQRQEVLETEPVTPPRPDVNQLDEDSSSNTPSRSKETASEDNASRFLRQEGKTVKPEASSSKENTTESALISAPPTRRRLSGLFSRNDDTLENRVSRQGPSSPPDLRATRRRSNLVLVNSFRHSPTRTATNNPQPATDPEPVYCHSQQPESRGIDNSLGNSSEESEPLRNKGPRKLIMLVKKISSGFRERGKTKAETEETEEKGAASTAAEAMVSPDGSGHSAALNIGERTEGVGISSNFPSRRATPRDGSTKETPQPTHPVSRESVHFTRGDRQLLMRLFKRFSSGSKGRTSEGIAKCQQNMRQDTPNKGAFFAKLFKRSSINDDEKESETGTTPHQGLDDAGPSPVSSDVPESQTWWGQLSQKVTRFLGMLVH